MNHVPVASTIVWNVILGILTFSLTDEAAGALRKQAVEKEQQAALLRIKAWYVCIQSFHQNCSRADV